MWLLEGDLKYIPPLRSCSFIGELGLSGQLRQTNNIRQKIEEAIRLGIKNILLPETEIDLKENFDEFIKIKEISNIKEAVNYALNN